MQGVVNVSLNSCLTFWWLVKKATNKKLWRSRPFLVQHCNLLDRCYITGEQVIARHTIRPVFAGTVPVYRHCPGQSTKKSRFGIESANMDSIWSDNRIRM